MIKATLKGDINIYTFLRKAQVDAPNYSIFTFKKPYAMSINNMKRLSIGEDSEEVGVLLGNKKMIDIKSTHVGFKGKKAMSFKFAKNMIIKMETFKSKDFNYLKWLKSSEPYIFKLKPSYVMIPLNPNYNINSFEGCNIAIQELNSALFLYSLGSDIILYQQKESLSSLSFIVGSLGYSDKLTICLNLDYLYDLYGGFQEILAEIYKFNIENRISMIYTSNYDDRSPILKEFLSNFNDEVIVYGKKI